MGKRKIELHMMTTYVEHGGENDERHHHVSDIKGITESITNFIRERKYDALQKLLSSQFIYPDAFSHRVETVSITFNDKRHYVYNSYEVSAVIEALYETYPAVFESLIGVASVSEPVARAFLNSLKGTDLANYQWDLATRANVETALLALKTDGVALTGKQDVLGGTVTALVKRLNGKLPDEKMADVKDAKVAVARFKDKLNFISDLHSEDKTLETGRSCLRFISCFNVKTTAEDKVDAVQLAVGLPNIKPRQFK